MATECVQALSPSRRWPQMTFFPGRFFRQTVADPRRLDLWIGLPPSARPSVAWMEPPLPDDDTPVVRQMLASQATPEAQQAMTAGEALPFPAENGIVTMNDPVLQAAELPGINGIGTARSLARLYAACVGDLDGVPRLLTADSVADASVPRSWGQMVLGDPDRGQRWGTGFMLSSSPARPMLSEQSFGHDGAGGQLGFADPAHRVGFAYLSRQMGPLLDERANVLVRALGRCLGVPEPSRTPAAPSPSRSTPEGIHE
ncbi:MAG: hypothetical protein QG671_323 [Actinomycetota bacterium]|nr:hypothetical protein [Actinomycetota bacterium]